METRISVIADSVDRLVAFIKEREEVRKMHDMAKMHVGAGTKWTDDPILANYRFCNVRREDDKVTKWIAKTWRKPHAHDSNLWFAMCLARLHNLPSTLEHLGYPSRWDEAKYLRKIKMLKLDGKKIFNGAYIISTQGVAMEKTTYIAERVLTPLWTARKRLQPQRGDTLQAYHMQLGQMEGFGSFMTAQVIADLKYAKPLSGASDWWTFAASGPGSRRGLNYIFGRAPDSPWREDDWRLKVASLLQDVNKKLKVKLPELHAQDLQNCLCEFSKYMRAVTTGQMPKQKYTPAAKALSKDFIARD